MLNIKYFQILILLIIVLSLNNLYAQNKSNIKENNIKSVTVYEEKFEKGKNKNELIESVTVFDKKGNIIEQKEFDNEGKLKSHFQYKYDDLSRKIKETELDENGSIIETIEYKYQGNLRTERIKYDGKGKIISKKRYEYSKFE